jgi:exopolyphosphatase/pppGpp-phosphohydrolase
VRALELGAVTEERRAVFPGGVVIMAEIFDALKLQQMRFAEGALRDGLLHDMIGRYGAEDARERTVSSMQQRYHVDAGQAGRVEATLLGFLAQVRESWELAEPLAEQTLEWAARLHEIGLDVAHSGYRQHGAYLLENADHPAGAKAGCCSAGQRPRKLALGGLGPDSAVGHWRCTDRAAAPSRCCCIAATAPGAAGHRADAAPAGWAKFRALAARPR